MLDLRNRFHRNSVRVVFDTNVFNGSTLDSLDHGPFRALCRSGRIVPIYGHILQEELLRSYTNATKRTMLLENWLPLISATASTLCRCHSEIWHDELVQGHGRHTRIFLSRFESEALLNSAKGLPRDGQMPRLALALQTVEKERLKIDSMRGRLRELREFKGVDELYGTTFSTFLNGHLIRSGINMLDRAIDSNYSLAVAERWARSPNSYPFFTQFVISALYLPFHARVHQNDRMDKNALADLELMTHLLHSDILVSNEKGFLRKAFDDLWKQRRRVLMNSDEFAQWLNAAV